MAVSMRGCEGRGGSTVLSDLYSSAMIRGCYLVGESLLVQVSTSVALEVSTLEIWLQLDKRISCDRKHRPARLPDD